MAVSDRARYQSTAGGFRVFETKKCEDPGIYYKKDICIFRQRSLIRSSRLPAPLFCHAPLHIHTMFPSNSSSVGFLLYEWYTLYSLHMFDLILLMHSCGEGYFTSLLAQDNVCIQRPKERYSETAITLVINAGNSASSAMVRNSIEFNDGLGSTQVATRWGHHSASPKRRVVGAGWEEFLQRCGIELELDASPTRFF
ncbi:hypothetical protein OUZ56_024954 [Daphnia magna]|uniref:Uncharacterized protein n=1 Tax=Daphnia magna TaxID=35525 RepID=A0ABQ9ZIH0_9CRUS|nr:hypothetical protein OUZ56_024954 [Daphnia magna]